jgi:hypothetical protein
MFTRKNACSFFIATSSTFPIPVNMLSIIFIFFSRLVLAENSLTGARNYRHSFRENKPKTLVFYD